MPRMRRVGRSRPCPRAQPPPGLPNVWGCAMTDGPTITIERACELLHCRRSRVFELLADGLLVRGPRYGRTTTIVTETVLAALEVGTGVSDRKRRRGGGRPATGTSYGEVRDAVKAALRGS